MRSGCLVLCYHAVTGHWEDPLAVDAETLERQVKLLLAQRYIPVGAAAALANERRTLHVTFDDGFRSVASVLDVLERLGVPVTIFACARLAEDGGQFLFPELRRRLPANRDELLTLSWGMLRDLAERGVEIGSHTMSHPHLPELPDDQLLAELRHSRERINDELGRPCRFLAYPYGQHDARVQAAARAAGYTAAFTLDPPARSFDPFAVPRVGVYGADNSLRFALKTSGLRRSLLSARSALGLPSTRT